MPSPESLRVAMHRARQLAQQLDADTAREVREAIEPSVVTWRWAAPHSSPCRPEPWFEERRGGRPRQSWQTAPSQWGSKRVGLDAHGRPVIVERHDSGRVRLDEV